ncbi:ribbon-helix-helix domain-containing protein [Acidianus ambivalens]|uniref:CopG family transcriptional regulator n=1 Tax=Acidianus ambivalens TaxID=2283 RepID=A0A650CTL8_ACIAM|nr:ribbon-helix-helix domain-containing protein [Acidianus ambivalens]MQL56438.1 CopG family transcriptional regulator [Acidianus ambivalens]QGR21075.1 CopG family transcriptional regulator [Acidianus ambivalens]
MTDAEVVPAIEEEIKVVTVKMPAILLDAIDRYARNHRLYRSEVIRMAILRFLEEAQKQ